MPAPLKPPALRQGDAIRILSLASPVEESRVAAGCQELVRLGYVPKLDRAQAFAGAGFFAGSSADRVAALKQAFSESDTRAIFSTRGGYGSNYLLDAIPAAPTPNAKVLLGYSDITSLQIFLWQKFGYVSFYGPMLAHGFSAGAGAAKGYDDNSLHHAITETQQGWSIDLQGEAFAGGEADGTVLGGCLALIETTLGTPWELDTRDSILLLEDCDMKPYQVDRALMHLKQASKLNGVRGIIFGEFPGCEGAAGSETVCDVVRRVLLPADQPATRPIVFGAAVGHTNRPMLTIPLGVRARLRASATSGGAGSTQLDILEPAVV